MTVGALTAVAVRVVVWPGMDMVVAMIVGMALGMLHTYRSWLHARAAVRDVQCNDPASLIGMYGGMLFGMRDSMAAGSQTLPAEIAVGSVFGAIVVAGVEYYDRTLRGTVVDSGD